MKTKSCSHGRAVDSFLAQHGADVTGVSDEHSFTPSRGSSWRIRQCQLLGDIAADAFATKRRRRRPQTAMTNPEAFRVYRTPESQPHGPHRWMMLRKSVADAPRRAEICAAVNDRYFAALAAANVQTPAGQLAAPLGRRVTKKRRRYRALNPWAPATLPFWKCSPAASGPSPGCATATCARLFIRRRLIRTNVADKPAG